jgi:hypothetical protein
VSEFFLKKKQLEILEDNIMTREIKKRLDDIQKRSPDLHSSQGKFARN